MVSNFQNMIITTTYNLKQHQKYRFVGFLSKHKVDDEIISINISNEKISLRNYLNKKYGIKIEDSNQPVIRAIRYGKNVEVYLVPEYSQIIFEYYEISKSVYNKLQTALIHHQHLRKFQKKIGIQFNDQLLLRQW